MQTADQPVTLADSFRRGGLDLDFYFRRIVQVALRNTMDGGWHGGGKQRDLASDRGLFHDPFDVFDEAHAQHFVGFVQHQGLQAVEFEGFPAQVIHHAPRRTDYDMDTAFQLAELCTVILSAINRHDMETGQVCRIALEGFRDLDCQFTGWSKHQNLWLALAQIQP